MAKSLRSKWRRKCRAIKRVRYGAKELARLKKTLGIDENAPVDTEMKELKDIVTVTDSKSIKESKNNANETSNTEDNKMDDGTARIYNKKTLLDQYGNYPVWMNRRKILKHKKGRAKTKKSTLKKDKRLTRKDKKKQRTKA
ncbi:PREDICTED: protein LLP homolog [Ceratosolen solmsi marchali]|uniref:Protein LLP homolog n=1 Tax=Ceratosolen solmsi marchali TaxID=326594 RepID=A0AAJ6YU99_9HYME|nr:PREDICTED: protein LLP homolog [Ceratosolen solmsi marchali]